MRDVPLPHRIEYTRNKHSRAVAEGNTIVIRLARNLSRTEEQRHIASLLRRMERLMRREHAKIAIDPFRPLLEGASEHMIFLANGHTVLVRLLAGGRTKAKRTREGWDVTVGPRLGRSALHRFLWSLLSREYEEEMEQLVLSVNRATLLVPLKKIRLRFARTQWGSCSSTGVIMLNTALLFVPRNIVTYIIVHELAHRKVRSHNRAFWRVVEGALPGYEEAYRTLRGYRLPRE